MAKYGQNGGGWLPLECMVTMKISPENRIADWCRIGFIIFLIKAKNGTTTLDIVDGMTMGLVLKNPEPTILGWKTIVSTTKPTHIWDFFFFLFFFFLGGGDWFYKNSSRSKLQQGNGQKGYQRRKNIQWIFHEICQYGANGKERLCKVDSID